MRPPVRGFGPQQPRGAADPSATRPAFMNNSGSEPNSPGVAGVYNRATYAREKREALARGGAGAGGGGGVGVGGGGGGKGGGGKPGGGRGVPLVVNRAPFCCRKTGGG